MPIYQRLININGQVGLMNWLNTHNVYSRNKLSACVGKSTDLLYCRSIDLYLISYAGLSE